MLYCRECREFVGKMRKSSEANAGVTAGPSFGADYSPSAEIQTANSSLRKAHELENGMHMREAAEVYAHLGLETEVRRVEDFIAEHPEAVKEIPDD